MTRKILVADDDRSIVELLKLKLHSRGYSVITAHEGVTALKMIKLHKPDLAVLDVLMPTIDGFTVDLEVEDEEDIRKMPIIMITGRPELKEVFDKTKEAKVDAWFIKPLDMEALVKKIGELLKATDC